jgi:transcriptional regulator NrdR family protein
MSELAVDVVKRRGKRVTERFDPDKLYRSLLATCMSEYTPEGHAHDIAHKVSGLVVVWCSDKPEVTSTDIRLQAAKLLERLHPEAAYIYKHHRVMM